MQNSASDYHTIKSQGKTNRTSRRNFVFHLHPPRVSAASIRFNRTFGLGGMAALLFVVQAFTGILLRFIYEPSPEKAYDSILHIQHEILFGQFVRNIHHWSGIFFVLVAFFHLLRVFIAQAIYKPRRVNWIIGIGLFIMVILSNFTGYLLPWDQLSFWAVTVATSLLEYIPLIGGGLQQVVRGGADVGSATLLNFYNFHTGIFPVVMIVLMIYHFWKVRKAKGVAVPANAADEKVPSNPNLVLKELVVATVLIAVIFLTSALVNAPLLDRANPAFSPNPAKAPWYFMGVQELLLHIHPFFAVVVIPVLFFGGLIYLPFAKLNETHPGDWFHSEKGKKLAIQSAVLALFLTPIVIILDEYFLHFENWLGNMPQVMSDGLVPFLLLLATFLVYIIFLIKNRKAATIEVIISLFVVFVVSYSVLTIIGIWFRGEGMSLIFPF
jgi:quinol-cytochrome oxidoreductase complex cytochrome b subunit